MNARQDSEEAELDMSRKTLHRADCDESGQQIRELRGWHQ